MAALKANLERKKATLKSTNEKLKSTWERAFKEKSKVVSEIIDLHKKSMDFEAKVIGATFSLKECPSIYKILP